MLRASLRSQRVPSAICAVRKTLSPISKKRPETARCCLMIAYSGGGTGCGDGCPVSCHAQTQGTATGPPATTTPTKRFGALGVWPGGRGQVPVAKAVGRHGTLWNSVGRRDPCRRVQQQRNLKPSLAIACSLRRKPTPRSFVRSYSAWPAIGCGRPWKRTTRRHQLIALCGAGGFSPHAARLERARELVLCGTQIDLLHVGRAINSRVVHRVRPRLLDGLG